MNDVVLRSEVTVIDVLALVLEHEPCPSDQTLAGCPTVASADLLACGSGSSWVDIGVWELTPGTVIDVEEDEIFVVLSGRGVLEFRDSDAIVHLHAGSLVTLQAGAHTRWTITETVRKLYLAPRGNGAAHDIQTVRSA